MRVVRAVVISPGAMTAMGDGLPYWLRQAIMFMGINCREEMLSMRNVHISSLAVSGFARGVG